MTKTTNLQLNKPDRLDFYNIALQNENMDIIDSAIQEEKTTVEELKKSVSDGKTLVAVAITDKGVDTATDAPFATMAGNIDSIKVGDDTSDATASAGNIIVGATAYARGQKLTGSMNDYRSTEITGMYNENHVANYPDVGVYNHYNAGNYLELITRPITNGYSDNTTALKTWITNLTKEKIQAGVVIGPTGGAQLTGTYTSDGTATAAQILSGKIAYVNGAKITGSMADKTGTTEYTATAALDSTNSEVEMTVPAIGYYSTSNKLKATYATLASLIGLTSAKLASGNTILGIAGNSNVVDTSAGTAYAAQILADKVAYVDGAKITGTMLDLTTADQQANGVSIADESKLKLMIPSTGHYMYGKYIYSPYANVTSAIGLTADKLVKGNAVLGVTGTGGNRYIKVANAAEAGTYGSSNCQQVILNLYTTSLYLNTGSYTWDNYIPYFTWAKLGISWVPSIVKVTFRFTSTSSSSVFTYEIVVTTNARTTFIKHLSTGSSTYYGLVNDSKLIYIQDYSSDGTIAGVANAYNLLDPSSGLVIIPTGYSATAANYGTFSMDIECWE